MTTKMNFWLSKRSHIKEVDDKIMVKKIHRDPGPHRDNPGCKNANPGSKIEFSKTECCFSDIIGTEFEKSKSTDRFISSRASNPFFPRFLRRRIKKVRSSFCRHLIFTDSKSRLSLNIFFDHAVVRDLIAYDPQELFQFSVS